MKYILIFIFTPLFFFSQNINTNPYWEGQILLTNGTVKKGLVKVPNSKSVTGVSIKSSESGSAERIPEKEIQAVMVTSDTGKSYLFERMPIVTTLKGNASLGNSFLMATNKNDYVTFYILSSAYKVNKKTGTISTVAKGNAYNAPAFYYFIRKKGKEKANLFYATNMIGGLNKSAKVHFTEIPDLIKRVKNREFKQKNIDDLIAAYISKTNDL